MLIPFVILDQQLPNFLVEVLVYRGPLVYNFKNYWDPKELLLVWVVAMGMYHIRN